MPHSPAVVAEHTELVSEMGVVEKMSTQERLKHARKRRIQQLKRWAQREKEYQQTKKKKSVDLTAKGGNKSYKVHFVPSVMLLEAAARNDVEEVRRLLMLGVSPDSTNEDGLTALHQCCIDDSEAMLKLLLEFGANVNAKDSEQWTPLHAAATCGHLHLVEYLIGRGADLLAVNADGNMPYDICEDESTLDYIESHMANKGITQEMIDQTRAISEKQMLLDMKYLIEGGGDVEYRDHQGATPLHIAAANGYISVVEFMLDNHASTNVCDNDMWQPIHAAACWGHPDVIEMLVMAGADLSAKTKNGETPFDICEDQDLKDRIMQLKNEIETKRASQPVKLKRSQSQNTRSQSVRRTSIRDKSLISRREAQEEARIRHEQQEQSGTDEDEEKLQQDMRASEKVQVSSAKHDDPAKECVSLHKQQPPSPSPPTNHHKEVTKNRTTDENHQPKSTITTKHHQVDDNNHQDSDDYHNHVEKTSDDQLALTNNGTVIQSAESVKVEIHVTVNTAASYPPNPGTLADLKKHRSDLRTRGSIVSQQSDGGQQQHTFSTTYLYDRPPSPTISLRRFCSDPSEVVGGEVHKQRCCIVM